MGSSPVPATPLSTPSVEPEAVYPSGSDASISTSSLTACGGGCETTVTSCRSSASCSVSSPLRDAATAAPAAAAPATAAAAPATTVFADTPALPLSPREAAAASTPGVPTSSPSLPPPPPPAVGLPLALDELLKLLRVGFRLPFHDAELVAGL